MRGFISFYHGKKVACALIWIMCILILAGCGLRSHPPLTFQEKMACRIEYFPAKQATDGKAEEVSDVLGDGELILSVEILDVVHQFVREGNRMDGRTLTTVKVKKVLDANHTIGAEENTELNLVQDYYFCFENDMDFARYIEGLGGVVYYTTGGKPLSFELADGQYEVKLYEGISYILYDGKNVLPMETGKEYLVVINDTIPPCRPLYVVPTENREIKKIPGYDHIRLDDTHMKWMQCLFDTYRK